MELKEKTEATISVEAVRDITVTVSIKAPDRKDESQEVFSDLYERAVAFVSVIENERRQHERDAKADPMQTKLSLAADSTQEQPEENFDNDENPEDQSE